MLVDLLNLMQHFDNCQIGLADNDTDSADTDEDADTDNDADNADTDKDAVHEIEFGLTITMGRLCVASPLFITEKVNFKQNQKVESH